ncbi:MAG: hypothetical protein AB8G05_17765 [Oligoflexales bacterium]
MNIHNELEELVGKWCDRGGCPLLREVLKVFHQVNPLTDGKHQLYEGLRKIEGATRNKMTDEEDKKFE